MNPVAESLTGWKFKEAFNKPSTLIFNIINEDTRKRVQSPIEKVIALGKIVGLANHTILIRKDGREIPIDDSGAPIKDAQGNILGVVLVFRDITERKETERQLLESEASLKRSQEIAHLGSWELDLRTNTLSWSDEIFRIFGLKPQEFKATYEAFLDAIHPQDRTLVDDAYTGSLKNGNDTYEVEHRVIRKNTREIRYVHEKCFHIKDETGKVILSTGMVHDITERKLAEIALKESEEQVRKKLESILNPENDTDDLELEDIINTDEIQTMMEHLYDLTSIPMAIIDNKGKVLVGVGWQKICTDFHRTHPLTCKNCIESDVKLTSGIPQGEFKLYKCANGMWDIATPLIIGGHHKGSIFMGQFFFDDEEIDVEAFTKRAVFYGFNKEEYLEALSHVYRISRKRLESAKGFFLNFANKISRLSYSNIKLARSISERDLIHEELLRQNHRLNILSETAGRLLESSNPQKIIDELCIKIMRFLNCDMFVNYMIDPKTGILLLNASGGISPQTAKAIKWLNLGVAVCGCVASDGQRIIAEDIQQSDDPRTELVKSFGMQAYCCHPLMGQDKVLGTLSFGTKGRKKFSDEEISMMKMVADLVAIALNRIKYQAALEESEKNANQRAEELQKMMNIVPSAIWIAQDPQCLEIIGNATANTFYEAKEGENVSAGKNPLERKFFRNGRELSPDELTMQEAASTGSDIRNSELEVLLPSGKWMTMLGNASPLKDENGNVRGCIGAFMDISDRKKAEKESMRMIELLQISNESQNAKDFIHASLKFFQKLSDFDAVGLRLKEGDDYPYYETIGFSKEFVRSEKYLCTHDCDGNILKDKNSRPLLECLCGQVIIGRIKNDSTFSTPYGSIWSNSTTDFDVKALEEKLKCRIRNRCNKEGFESVSLVPLKLGNEHIGLLQLNNKRKDVITAAKIDLIEKLAGPFTIALARFRAEEELQKKEENLRQHAEMLEHAPVMVRTMQGEITVWNSGMEELYGYNRAEALGEIEEELLKTEFPKPLPEIMQELLQENHWEGELKQSCKDGTLVEVLSLWTLHNSHDGKPDAIIEVNKDITNRKKKELEIQRINRILNALGKSSKAMMHSQNEMQFINEACKILVEDCGHALVWIGYTEDDENKTVRPIAHYGFDDGYTEKLKVSWGDNEYAAGPTGMSIKTGKAVMSRHIVSDPVFQPWRNEALNRGFNSSISLPFLSEGKAFGVLTLYSRESNSFSPDEVELLTSLANDITFGIKTFRLKESENTALALLRESEERYRSLFNEMVEGFAYMELLTDEKGTPKDYLFLNVNPAFEEHTGLKANAVIGKKATEIYPGNPNYYWLGIYADVALKGENREFEVYNSALNRYFRVSAFSDKKGFFATIFENITERVLSQKELQSTKKYLESLISYANAPIIVWNPELKIQLFNQAFEHLTGYQSAEIIGKKIEILFPAESLPETRQKIQQAIYKQWEAIEIPILTKDRQIRTILWNSANIYDSDTGNLISVIAQGNDITERKKAEEELRQSEQKFSIMFQSVPIGISLSTIPDWKLYDVNQAWLDIIGITNKEEAVNKTSLDLGIIPDQQTHERLIQDFNNYGRIRNKVIILNKNGAPRYISVNIDRVEIKGQQYMLSSNEDISDRIKAEDAIRKTQEKLNMALDNGNIGTWEKDLKSNNLIWDKRMEKMFGFEAGTFDGQYGTFEKCLVDEDIPYVREAMRKAIEENFPYESVYRIKTKSGNISYINAKASLIRDKKGKPIRMAGVSFDVTDMKKGAERILIKLNEDLHRSNKELEQFAYVASHDLQEPLRMVSSFTQLLAQRYKDKLDQDGKEFIRYAVDGAVRMQRLINDLLNYSRIGTRGQKFTEIDFNEIFKNSISNLKFRIEEKNAVITCDKLPTLKADEIQMIQLLQNLIGNAIKFCNTVPIIHISSEENGNFYQFSVKDNGIGIEEQYFDKIFLIFQRLLPKDQYEGTGIGLAICKRIIERHGGRMWVDSTNGKGTTFYFTLIKNINL